MKKLFNILLITILLIPMMVNAAECDTSKVYISSIAIDKSTGNVSELEDATAKDKKVNLNLQMATQNDEILYKVVLKNDSSEDYEINKNSISLNSDYIEYSLESDNNNIVKANSTRTIYLRVKYKTPVDPSKFVNGVYQDSITMKVNIRTDDTPANPNTGVSYIIVFSIILLLSGVALIIYKKKKISTLMILVGLILLPIGVKALCTCEIIVDSKVLIATEDEFKMIFYKCNRTEPSEHTITYKIGMNFNEFKNSEYYTQLSDDDKYAVDVIFNDSSKFFESEEYENCIRAINWPDEMNSPDYNTYMAELREASNQERTCAENNGTSFLPTDKIKGIESGVYRIKEGNCIG